MGSKAASVLLILLLWCNAVELVRVKVEQGWLQGSRLITTTKLTEYCSFKGVPYAAPPLGKLRFRAPEAPPKWKGIRNATEHGSICVQPVSYTNNRVIGDENCLFLNIYSPNINPKCLLPVMFFMHGGTYIIGSGNDDQYSPDFLMSHGVVLVTLNFRLGVFGFLAVDTEDVPGNAGMKDTIAALQWVKKNIAKFGGDPDRVTIFGQSSGAAMTTLHVVSPAAKNLFHRAIAMSGSLFNDWSTSFEPRRRAFALGRELGIDTNDSYKLVNFLRSVRPEKLSQARPEIFISDNITNTLYILTYFTPNVEKVFDNEEGQYLTTSPTILMSKRQINPVDFMMGHTALEGAKNTAENEDLYLQYFPKYKQLLVPLRIAYFRSPKKVLELSDRVLSLYFKNQTISRRNILDFVQFDTYFDYVFYIHVYMDRMPQLPGVRRYFYQFGIESTRNVYSRLPAIKFGTKEATHKDDIPYLFDGSYYNQTVDVNSEAFKYVQLMCTLYTNFAKFGNPTPDDSLGTWPQYDPNRSAVAIQPNGTLGHGQVVWDQDTNLMFWRDVYISAGINIVPNV